MQERVEIALPKDFSTMTENANVFAEFFTKGRLRTGRSCDDLGRLCDSSRTG